MSNVLHIIPKIVQGGAEKLLIDYIASNHSKHEHSVLTLFNNNDIDFMSGISHSVQTRNSKNYTQILLDIKNVNRYISKYNYDLIFNWMYHTSVLSPIIIPKNKPQISYIHNTDLSKTAKIAERLAQRLIPHVYNKYSTAFVYSGTESCKYHQSLGYPIDNTYVLPNGIDTDLFRINTKNREDTKDKLGIPHKCYVFGAFGRFNSQKNWPLIIKAVTEAHKLTPSVRLVAAGNGVEFENKEFLDIIDDYGARDIVIALGRQNLMAPLYSSIDMLLIASQYGEAFPLVLLEAMSSGKPSICTRLGSIPEIVNNFFETIPIGDDSSFIRACISASTGNWPDPPISGDSLRAHVVNNYSLLSYIDKLDSIIEAQLEEGQTNEN